MKALIFAAGLGTRLRPLTDNLPKALVPVGGIPMLQRVILNLKEKGFDDITINIHHLGQQIIDFVKANQDFGVRIRISNESNELLDTGGGILKARPYLESNEPFLVHNVDILTDFDIAYLYAQHIKQRNEVTLLVSKRNTTRYLLFDSSGQLHGWVNKKTGEIRPSEIPFPINELEEWAFGGIHVISPSIFRYMEEGRWEGNFPIIPFYLSICKDVRIKKCPLQEHSWFDIGKPESLKQAELYIQSVENL